MRFANMISIHNDLLYVSDSLPYTDIKTIEVVNYVVLIQQHTNITLFPFCLSG